MKSKNNINKSSVELLLDYISGLSKQLHDSYHFLSLTEFGGMMHNILLGMRRLENYIIEIEDKQQNTLLNVVPFDIDKVKNAVSHIMVDIADAQMFDVEDKSEEENTDWKETISLENQAAPFTLGDDYAEYTGARLFLMKNIGPNYFKIAEAVRNIKKHLEYIIDQNLSVLYNGETRRGIYHKMIKEYQETEWNQDYANFIYQTKKAVEDGTEEGKGVIEVLKNELGSLTSQNYNTFMQPAIKAVFRTVTNPRLSPADAIVKNRMKLEEDDVSSFFSYYFRYSLLRNHIDSIPLFEPVKGKYSQLFVNKAAKEYVDILMPIIWKLGGIREKGHVGILLLAMSDLGLTNKENKPYIPMMNYANETNADVEKLRFNEQSMISKTVGLLGPTPFCELEYGDVGDSSFDTKKIENLQDVYVLCFRILNNGGLVKPDEKKIASYILDQQKPFCLDFERMGVSNELRDRLDFLRSVIRRETLLFD